jgi:hypothetical protein
MKRNMGKAPPDLNTETRPAPRWAGLSFLAQKQE